jgi:hypothetical protein
MSITSTITSTALAPFKDYIYGGVIALLIAGFGWYTLHERSVQHDKDVAAQLQEIQVSARKAVVITQTADAVVAKAEIRYVKVTTAPPVADLGLVCRDSSSSVPGRTASDQGGTIPGRSVQGDLFDPSGELLTAARLYGATISELQTTNAALRQLIADAKAARVKP